MRLLLLAGMLAQLIPGLWFLDAPKEYRGLTEGSAITFSVPVDKLAAGTYVQFGVTLENGGPQAPRHYIVEAQEGAEWVRVGEPFTDGRSDYSFVAAKSEDLHPSTYLTVFPLRKPVRDSLRVRCRVCSQYATDGSTLSAAADGNTVHLMARCYVAGRLNPLGRHLPVAHKSVLLIGNSFTYFYGVPFMLQEIAWSQGMWLNISTSLKGGQTLRQHCGLELSLRACSSHPYDFAFIQGQSQEPAQYASDLVGGRDVKAALCQLCDNIRGVSPDCSIYVEQTWAYPAGDCGGFGSLERFDGLL
ncbi:MAG: hypothetical protein IKZ91_02640, partial [Bacteroidales bacterium]|nr:hypothetical protein [Bacteroidales bacterium]